MAQNIDFCVCATGRNRFLQPPSGLFGGDESLLGEYVAQDDHYTRSVTYAHTAASWSPNTNVPLYQRQATAAWYATATATVIAAPVARCLSLRWDVSPSVWGALRVPGQIVTFVHDGQVVHAPVTNLPAGPTGVTLLLPTDGPWDYLVPEAKVALMVRTKAPTRTLAGPIEQMEANVVLVQCSRDVIPSLVGSLLYLGGWNSHPLNTAGMDEPTVAMGNIFAVESTTEITVHKPLRPRSVTINNWSIATTFVSGFFWNTGNIEDWIVINGIDTNWPYVTDQSGEVWLLASPMMPEHPDSVIVVRAIIKGSATSSAIPGPFVKDGKNMNGFILNDGERILEVNASTTEPNTLAQWNAAMGTFDRVTVLSLLLENLDHPDASILIVSETKASFNSVDAFDCVLEGSQRVKVRTSYSLYKRMAHLPTKKIDSGLVISVLDAPGYLVLMTRSNTYGPNPRNILTNLNNNASSMWTYPVNVDDGTDRVDSASLIDGFVEFKRLASVPRSAAELPSAASVAPAPLRRATTSDAAAASPRVWWATVHRSDHLRRCRSIAIDCAPPRDTVPTMVVVARRCRQHPSGTTEDHAKREGRGNDPIVPDHEPPTRERCACEKPRRSIPPTFRNRSNAKGRPCGRNATCTSHVAGRASAESKGTSQECIIKRRHPRRTMRCACRRGLLYFFSLGLSALRIFCGFIGGPPHTRGRPCRASSGVRPQRPGDFATAQTPTVGTFVRPAIRRDCTWRMRAPWLPLATCRAPVDRVTREYQAFGAVASRSWRCTPRPSPGCCGVPDSAPHLRWDCRAHTRSRAAGACGGCQHRPHSCHRVSRGVGMDVRSRDPRSTCDTLKNPPHRAGGNVNVGMIAARKEKGTGEVVAVYGQPFMKQASQDGGHAVRCAHVPLLDAE